MHYYIVEHPTRGTYIDRELQPGLSVVWKYKFSWSCLRTDERVHKFFDLRKARNIAEAVPNSYVLKVVRHPRLTITQVKEE